MRSGDEKLWQYNAEDCCRTFEIFEAQQQVVDQMGLRGPHDFQQALFAPVLRTMTKGCRLDEKKRAEMLDRLQAAEVEGQKWLEEVVGHKINIKSPKQIAELFYSELGQAPYHNRKTGGVTTDDEALDKIAAREPLLKPVVEKLAEMRSLGVFTGTFLRSLADPDGRLRAAFNIAGTVTFRFSSSENVWGNGTNLQNWSKGGGLLPNLRELIIPDEGYTFFDIDLSAADLRIVVWESDCKPMKEMFAAGLDPYTEVSKEYYNDPSITKADPRRQMFKSFAHGCITGDHEVLTPHGWKSVASVQDEEQIAVWDSTNEQIWFEVPRRWNRDATAPGEPLVKFEGQAFDQLVTLDHRMPYTVDATGWHTTTATRALTYTTARFPKSGFYNGPVTLPCARLVVAYIADGTIDAYGNVRFHFHKSRKKDRLRQLLGEREFTEGEDYFYIPRRSSTDFTAFGKSYANWLLELDGASLDAIIEELQFWDGTKGPSGAINFFSTDVNSLQWLRTIIHLRGKASQYQGATVSGFGSTVHRCSINNRPKAWLNSFDYKGHVNSAESVAVYCPQTTTGFFLVRRNGKISVTGNTNYLGKAKNIAPRVGLSVAEAERTQAWYFNRFPEIRTWQERLVHALNTTGRIRNAFGYQRQFFDRIEGNVYNEAAAWIPQSTVAIVINHGYVNIHRSLPAVDVLLQVHDSLAGQFPSSTPELADAIVDQCSIRIPYADPLIIPVGIKTSEASWGACE
jgi:DNA polymerase I-like protein with 3'-5' exonuclease and polymerase domains